MDAPKTRLKDPKVCRIFVSSPFNGMEGEREALTKLYWPRIQSLCSSKGIQFVPVDMRWGITSEMADNAQTINICLREADRSDMFVGFYGQRYGWFGAEDEALQRNFDVASAQYPWVDAYRDRSVTEIEFLHGHLNNPGKLPAVICFRDKTFDNDQLAMAEQKGDTKGIHAFSPESEQATIRLNDLKQRVNESQDKSLAVHGNYKDPAEGAKLMFDTVWKHLNEVILKDTVTKELGKRESESLLHTSFGDSHDELYVGGEKNFGILNQMISNPEKPVILITGEAGCGKSALLANWVKQRKEQTDSDDILIYHFVGSTNESTAGKNIMQRLIGNMKYRLNPDDEEKDGPYTKLVDSNIWAMAQKLREYMNGALEKKRNVTLVVDGLNQIRKEGQISKPMYWCPPEFPRGVHIIMSTQSTDTENIEEVKSTHNCQTLTVEPLSGSERRAICENTLLMRGKQLSAEQLARVVETENTKNPLYLKIILEELCMFGRFRELSEKIESLVSSKNAQELFDKYLERLEADYNTEEYEGNMVEKVVRALFVSRRGLTETELTEMFNIPSHLWSPLYFSLEKYLVNRQGFLAFVHEELKLAVKSRYLDEPSKWKSAYMEQIDFFSVERLTSLQVKEKIPGHHYTELPWLCRQAEDKELLLKILHSPVVFDRLYTTHRRFELLAYWQYMDMDPVEILQPLLRAIDVQMIHRYCLEMDEWREHSNPAKKGAYYLDQLEDFFSLAHFSNAHEQVLVRIKKIYEVNNKFDEEYKKQHIVAANYSLACRYTDDCRYQEGLELHLEGLKYYQEKIKENPSDPDTLQLLADAWHGCAIAYYDLKMWDEAAEGFTKAGDIYREHPDETTKTRRFKSDHMLAQVHAGQGKYRLAIEGMEKVAKAEEELYFGTLPPEMSYVLTNLGISYRKVKEYDKAEEVYNRAMLIKKNALGECHVDVAIAYINMGNLAMNRKNYNLASTYNAKALEIYEKLGKGDGRKGFITRDNLTLTLCLEGKMEEAEPYFWRAQDYVIQENLMDLALKAVQRRMIKHFTLTEQYDKAEKVILSQLGYECVTSSHYLCLAAIDECRAEDSGQPKVERPYEQSVRRGLELFPDDADLLTTEALQHLIPAKDLASINQLVEKYYEKKPSDSAKLIFELATDILEAKWNDGSRDLFQKWHHKIKPLAEFISEEELKNPTKETETVADDPEQNTGDDQKKGTQEDQGCLKEAEQEGQKKAEEGQGSKTADNRQNETGAEVEKGGMLPQMEQVVLGWQQADNPGQLELTTGQDGEGQKEIAEGILKEAGEEGQKESKKETEKEGLDREKSEQVDSEQKVTQEEGLGQTTGQKEIEQKELETGQAQDEQGESKQEPVVVERQARNEPEDRDRGQDELKQKQG